MQGLSEFKYEMKPYKKQGVLWKNDVFIDSEEFKNKRNYEEMFYHARRQQSSKEYLEKLTSKFEEKKWKPELSLENIDSVENLKPSIVIDKNKLGMRNKNLQKINVQESIEKMKLDE